jgi:hypothetical protein
VATAVAYGKLLESVILTGELNPENWYKDLPENHVKEEMKAVFEKKDCNHIETAKGFGIACCEYMLFFLFCKQSVPTRVFIMVHHYHT